MRQIVKNNGGRDGGDSNGQVNEEAPPSLEGDGDGGEALPMEQPITADVDIAGAQPEQVPEAPTLVQTSASALLALAPKVFKTTAQMSGLCVVLAGWIEREKLYTAEGFASMKEYAQKELGVAKSAYKKLHQAGEAVWKFYPELAEAALAAVATAGGHARVHDLPPPERAEAVLAVLATGHARVHELPHVPDQTTLSLLRRAHERTEPTERAAFLARVLEGQFSTRELAAIANPKPSEPAHAASAPEVGEEEEERGDGVPATETVTSTEVPPRAIATDDGSPVLPEQDPVAQVIWRLALNTRTLKRLPPGEIGADLLASMCEQLEEFQKVFDVHRKAAHA